MSMTSMVVLPWRAPANKWQQSTSQPLTPRTALPSSKCTFLIKKQCEKVEGLTPL